MNMMSAIRKNAVVAAVAIVGGFLGSAIHGWTQAKRDILRAKRFEVIDDSGTVLSFWGPETRAEIPATTPKGVMLVFRDPKGVRRCEIGARVGDFGPQLNFYDKSGPSEFKPSQFVPQPRFAVSLFYGDDPVLAMRGRDAWRVLLGAEHGDAPGPGEDTWSLRIRGGPASYALVTGYKTHFGQYGAGVLLRENSQSWSLPGDLLSRWNRRPR